MTVIHQIAETVDFGWLLGLMTVVFLITFIAWAVWAWLPGNKEAFEAASLLPLDDGDLSHE